MVVDKEKEREEERKEENKTKKPVAGTDLHGRLEIFRKLNAGTSHLWQIIAERSFL